MGLPYLVVVQVQDDFAEDFSKLKYPQRPRKIYVKTATLLSGYQFSH